MKQKNVRGEWPGVVLSKLVRCFPATLSKFRELISYISQLFVHVLVLSSRSVGLCWLSVQILVLPGVCLFLLDVCLFFRVDDSRSALSFVSSESALIARGISQALLGARMTPGEVSRE